MPEWKLLRLPARVEQTDDHVSVRFFLGKHLLIAGVEHPFRSDRILVDRKDFRVPQIFLQIGRVDVSKIDTEDKGIRSTPTGMQSISEKDFEC